MKTELRRRRLILTTYVKELTTRNSKDFHFLVVYLLVLLVGGLIMGPILVAILIVCTFSALKSAYCVAKPQ